MSVHIASVVSVHSVSGVGAGVIGVSGVSAWCLVSVGAAPISLVMLVSFLAPGIISVTSGVVAATPH